MENSEESKKEALTNYLKQKIHTSYRWVTVFKDDRTAYEYMLQERYGSKKRKVTSCKELNLRELSDLAAYMADSSAGVTAAQAFDGIKASHKQLRYISFMWQAKSRNKDEKSLLSFIRRQTGKEYMSLKCLSKEDVRSVIPALENLRDSATPRDPRDSATPRDPRDSATPRDPRDSATPRDRGQ